MSLVCALTGEVAQEPVATPQGNIYEKRVLLKHLETRQDDPVSGEQISVADLVPLKVHNTGGAKPRSPAAASIPGLLQTFQNEWDALMLETFTLRKQLHSAREELTHALYQNDAATRVIARLLKERDQARRDLEQLRQSAPAGGRMEVTAALPGLDNVAHQKLAAKAGELSAQRKTRTESPTLAKEEEVRAFKAVQTQAGLHKTTHPGILSVDIHPHQPELTVTGGVDSTAVIFSRKTGKKVATLSGHAKKVNVVAFHPTVQAVLTGSADHTVKVFQGEDYTNTLTFKQHTGEITALSLHATGQYLATSSLDRSWAFHDLETGKTLLQVHEPEEAAITCAMLHPDGLLLATGTEGNVIRIWDLKTQKNVATFQGHKGHVTDLRFSENGFYLSTASKDNFVKLWDLRGPKNVTSIKLDQTPVALAYDYSGKYLAAAVHEEVRVFVGKNLEHVTTLHDHSMPVTAVCWAPDAKFLASTSMDRSLKFWAAQ